MHDVRYPTHQPRSITRILRPMFSAALLLRGCPITPDKRRPAFLSRSETKKSPEKPLPQGSQLLWKLSVPTSLQQVREFGERASEAVPVCGLLRRPFCPGPWTALARVQTTFRSAGAVNFLYEYFLLSRHCRNRTRRPDGKALAVLTRYEGLHSHPGPSKRSDTFTPTSLARNLV
jgi:hypothetical protein